MISRLAGTLSVTLMNQVEAIPVYRDQPAKLRDTIRQSVSAMEAGDNLLIFPENSGEKPLKKTKNTLKTPYPPI